MKPGWNQRNGKFRKKYVVTKGKVTQVSFATGGYRFAEVIEKRWIPGRARRGKGIQNGTIKDAFLKRCSVRSRSVTTDFALRIF